MGEGVRGPSELPARLVFAPVDFERQTLREGLELAGFDPGRLAVFSWVGVTIGIMDFYKCHEFFETFSPLP